MPSKWKPVLYENQRGKERYTAIVHSDFRFCTILGTKIQILMIKRCRTNY